MAKITLEICCGSADDVVLAAKAGADRVELNSALFLGGLTPSVGTLTTALAECDIPVMAMLRPRAGGFCYTEREFASMKEDARALVAAGAKGLVFGILLPDGRVDVARTAELTALAHTLGVKAVFHRAIDVVPDVSQALEELIGAKVDRVLTSGQMPMAILGADTIAEMQKQARGRIEILPGAGVNARNVKKLLALTGCTQAHMSAGHTVTDTSCTRDPSLHFGSALYPPEDSYSVVTEARIAPVRAVLEEIQ